ncbi:MAG: hypothetical protein JO267_02495 [Alphaproteobacteria bacterium]|nr:hypothetical protein [Alphaproteobacteria bacterium]
MTTIGQEAFHPMPPDYFDYAYEKLISFASQITNLLASDFPIPTTRRALVAVQDIFSREIDRITSLRSDSTEIKKSACANANLKIRKFLPLLGFVLRSTNVRNSFEIAEPLTRLAKQLLKRELTFILSSEWDFSPLTYNFSFVELPDVILLGLPSFESANALMVPLVGHELGHWIWRDEDMESRLSSRLEDNIVNAFLDGWSAFQRIFGRDVDIGDIRTSMFAREIWTISFADSMRQCEEVFSDFVGLKLFGASYLHSFEYLTAPFTGEPRSREYPDMKTRAEFLSSAVDFFSFAFPSGYADHFENSTTENGPADRFLIEASDAATRATVQDLLDLTVEISAKRTFPSLSEQESEFCLTRIKSGVPAEGVEYIGNIINAGWSAYRDNTLLGPSSPGRRRIDILNELLLKSIEVAEFEVRMRDADAAYS